MAFGQQSGPPASSKQVEELLALFESAGYSSFREARHIYGLSQRQAGGKFTRSEADELIARLAAGDGENMEGKPSLSKEILLSTPSSNLPNLSGTCVRARGSLIGSVSMASRMDLKRRSSFMLRSFCASLMFSGIAAARNFDKACQITWLMLSA